MIINSEIILREFSECVVFSVTQLYKWQNKINATEMSICFASGQLFQLFFFFFPSIAFSQDSCRYKWVQDQAQMISWCVYVVLNISLKALLFKHIHLKCFLFLILACFTWLKWWRISKNNINHLNCLFCWKELKEFRWVSKWYLNSFSFYSTRMQYGMLYTVSVGFHKCSCPK